VIPSGAIPTAQDCTREAGALVFQVKQCHNCHALEGMGGQRGPALDSVAVHSTQDQLIRQVIQGGKHAFLRQKSYSGRDDCSRGIPSNAASGATGRRRGTLPELWHLEEAGRILPQSVPQVGHTPRQFHRIRTMVRFRPSYYCRVSCGIGLLCEVGRVSAVRFGVDFAWQLAAFMNGMFAVWIALGSPLRTFSPRTCSRSIWSITFY